MVNCVFECEFNFPCDGVSHCLDVLITVPAPSKDVAEFFICSLLAENDYFVGAKAISPSKLCSGSVTDASELKFLFCE